MEAMAREQNGNYIRGEHCGTPGSKIQRELYKGRAVRMLVWGSPMGAYGDE
jgi:hypothetical protein